MLIIWSKFKLMSKYIKTLCFIVSASLLGGCTSSAKVEQMTYKIPRNEFHDKNIFSKDLYGQIAIQELSELDTLNPNWQPISNINSEVVLTAIKSSLANENLYSKFGMYQLQLDLIEFSGVHNLSSSDVSSIIEYRLVNREENRMVFRDRVAVVGTADLGEELYGSERLKIAAERSIKQNIKALMIKLSNMPS